MSHRFYRDANLVFITPDSCLEQLRYRTLLEGKRILMTTYAITRGFLPWQTSFCQPVMDARIAPSPYDQIWDFVQWRPQYEQYKHFRAIPVFAKLLPERRPYLLGLLSDS